ncbi:helix-turn-helix transcriptional regulator [uncultured Enterococcus sp.]|uniref:helix-turn-helix domain-containing protein n=1 Tax=uncultured Enterococcus sp. TaxID=167972 RepID=UPI0028ED557E|nr:helix-turn-helix transcriptional regulator [uncultured Enterococcus sp.]
MNTYEIIKELAKEKKMSIRQLEMNFGYSNGYLAKWKNNTPNSDELSRIADFFNVSVDYLLGRETPSKETELRKALENVLSFDGEEMTESDKEAIIAYMMGRKGK